MQFMLGQGMEPHEAENWISNIHFGELCGLIAEEWRLPSALRTPTKDQTSPNVVQKASCDVTHDCYVFVRQLESELNNFQIQIDQGVLE